MDQELVNFALYNFMEFASGGLVGTFAGYYLGKNNRGDFIENKKRRLGYGTLITIVSDIPFLPLGSMVVQGDLGNIFGIYIGLKMGKKISEDLEDIVKD